MDNTKRTTNAQMKMPSTLLTINRRIISVYLLSSLALALIVATSIHQTDGAAVNPVGKYRSYRGCYYMYQHFRSGEQIKTDEPCLNCTCENSMLMCYLRVCPYVKPIGEKCIIERVPGECCPKITCSDINPPVDGLEQEIEPETTAPSTTTTTATASTSEVMSNSTEIMGRTEGCMLNDKYYHEGAQLPSDPNKPCEVCYCIRNTSACVMQDCALEVGACQPIYQPGSCCPSRYNCTSTTLFSSPRPKISEASSPRSFWSHFLRNPTYTYTTPISREHVLITSTTTVKPLAFPEFGRSPMMQSSGCKRHSSSRIFAEGERIPSKNKCEHCYCLRGEIICAVQECRPPCEGCTPIIDANDQCCPKRYECVAPTKRVSIDNVEDTPEAGPVSDLISVSGNTSITIAKSETSTTPSEPFYEMNSQTSGPIILTYKPTDANEPMDPRSSINGDTFKPEMSIMTTRQTKPPLRPISPKLSLNDDESSNEMIQDQDSTKSTKPESGDKGSVDGFNLNGEREQEIDPLKPIGRFVAPEGSQQINQPQDSNEVIPTALTSTITPIVMDQSTTQLPLQADNLASVTVAQGSRPLVVPSTIPGEGSCRYSGKIYQNGQEIKAKDSCMEICMCINSVVYCDDVDCPKPPENLDKCQKISREGECCPNYICEQTNDRTNEPVSSNLTEPITTTTLSSIESLSSTNSPISEASTLGNSNVESALANPTLAPKIPLVPEGVSMSNDATINEIKPAMETDPAMPDMSLKVPSNSQIISHAIVSEASPTSASPEVTSELTGTTSSATTSAEISGSTDGSVSPAFSTEKSATLADTTIEHQTASPTNTLNESSVSPTSETTPASPDMTTSAATDTTGASSIAFEPSSVAPDISVSSATPEVTPAFIDTSSIATATEVPTRSETLSDLDSNKILSTTASNYDPLASSSTPSPEALTTPTAPVVASTSLGTTTAEAATPAETSSTLAETSSTPMEASSTLAESSSTEAPTASTPVEEPAPTGASVATSAAEVPARFETVAVSNFGEVTENVEQRTSTSSPETSSTREIVPAAPDMTSSMPIDSIGTNSHSQESSLTTLSETSPTPASPEVTSELTGTTSSATTSAEISGSTDGSVSPAFSTEKSATLADTTIEHQTAYPTNALNESSVSPTSETTPASPDLTTSAVSDSIGTSPKPTESGSTTMYETSTTPSSTEAAISSTSMGTATTAVAAATQSEITADLDPKRGPYITNPAVEQQTSTVAIEASPTPSIADSNFGEVTENVEQRTSTSSPETSSTREIVPAAPDMTSSMPIGSIGTNSHSQESSLTTLSETSPTPASPEVTSELTGTTSSATTSAEISGSTDGSVSPAFSTEKSATLADTTIEHQTASPTNTLNESSVSPTSETTPASPDMTTSAATDTTGASSIAFEPSSVAPDISVSSATPEVTPAFIDTSSIATATEVPTRSETLSDLDSNKILSTTASNYDPLASSSTPSPEALTTPTAPVVASTSLGTTTAEAATPAETSSTPAETSSTLAETSSTPIVASSTPAETSSTPIEASSTPAETSSTPMEASSTLAEASSTLAETSSTPMEASSTPAETSSTLAETSSTPIEASSTLAETSSTPIEASSTPAETSSTPAETSSTPMEASSTPAETSSTPMEASSTPAETSSTPMEASSTLAESSSTETPTASTPVEEPAPTGASVATSAAEVPARFETVADLNSGKAFSIADLTAEQQTPTSKDTSEASSTPETTSILPDVTSSVNTNLIATSSTPTEFSSRIEPEVLLTSLTPEVTPASTDSSSIATSTEVPIRIETVSDLDQNKVNITAEQQALTSTIFAETSTPVTPEAASISPGETSSVTTNLMTVSSGPVESSSSVESDVPTASAKPEVSPMLTDTTHQMESQTQNEAIVNSEPNIATSMIISEQQGTTSTIAPESSSATETASISPSSVSNVATNVVETNSNPLETGSTKVFPVNDVKVETSSPTPTTVSSELNKLASVTHAPVNLTDGTASPADEFLSGVSAKNSSYFVPVDLTTIIPSIRGSPTPITIPWSDVSSNLSSITTTQLPLMPSTKSAEFSTSGTSTESDYEEVTEDSGCEYEGKTYNSAQQIPRSHPCDFCFCFRGDIICLQQTCPPPVPHCFETVMEGFCCPRYECPVHTVRSSANSTSLSLTPYETHSRIHKSSQDSGQPLSAKTSNVKGCFVDNKLYGVGQKIESASSPCLECKCDSSGMMNCIPKECAPEDPLLQQINREVLQSTLSRSQVR